MEDIVPDETLDCVGLYCPQPLFETREAIDKLQPGQVLMLLADDPAAEEDIKRFAKRTGHVILSYKRMADGIQQFLIKRKEAQ